MDQKCYNENPENFSGRERDRDKMLPWLLCSYGLLLSPGVRPHHQASLRAAVPRCGLSTEDPRVISVEIDRNTGIDFGCDLALRWPYVMSLVPNGAAERDGRIRVGDQLVAISGGSVIGLTIGDAMERLGTHDRLMELRRQVQQNASSTRRRHSSRRRLRTR